MDRIQHQMNYKGLNCDITYCIFCFISDPYKEKPTCFLPQRSGQCKKLSDKYFYDKSTMQCEQFIYGGEGGIGNQFDTPEDCRDNCQGCKERKCLRKCPFGFKRDQARCPTCECLGENSVIPLILPSPIIILHQPHP